MQVSPAHKTFPCHLWGKPQLTTTMVGPVGDAPWPLTEGKKLLVPL